MYLYPLYWFVVIQDHLVLFLSWALWILLLPFFPAQKHYIFKMWRLSSQILASINTMSSLATPLHFLFIFATDTVFTLNRTTQYYPQHYPTTVLPSILHTTVLPSIVLFGPKNIADFFPCWRYIWHPIDVWSKTILLALFFNQIICAECRYICVNILVY